MKQYSFKIVLLLFITAIIFSCAKRGRISGGTKDITPPKIVKAIPENYSTDFNGKEIKIYFDEYVKLEDLQKQLIISPPLKYDPIITPLGSSSKYITVKILDTLAENTTYSINFGQSIVDHNEGNPFSYFKYVFSTGKHIDSLTLTGTVNDAERRTPDKFVSVMLYRVDESFNDSIVYKEKPTYITNTLDSTNVFQLENLKSGKYLLVALKEENQNFVFNQSEDKIGFMDDIITIPSDSTYNLKLFKENTNFKTGRPKSKSKNRIVFGYEGDHKAMNIKLLSETTPKTTSLITKLKNKDSLNYWYKPEVTNDSLLFEISYNNKIQDTFTVKPRNKENDSLTFTATRGTLKFDGAFEISANNPIVGYNVERMSIFNSKDSTNVPFTPEFKTISNTLKLAFQLKEETTYKVEILPYAFKDFFDNRNDTLRYTLTTRTYADYGNIRVKLKNAPSGNLIVQLTDADAKVIYELQGDREAIFDFKNIDPNKYYLRVIVDRNNNKLYDTGNFLKRIQPERISYFPKELDVRPNWDLEQEFIMR